MSIKSVLNQTQPKPTMLSFRQVGCLDFVADMEFQAYLNCVECRCNIGKITLK